TVGKATGKDAGANKATAVAILGVAKAKEKLFGLVREAEQSLAPFGERADVLKAAARFVAERRPWQGGRAAMTVRKALCHCGRLELCCHGEPHRISMCHCIDCQRRTASTFSIALFYERAKARIVRGMPRSYERQSASGFPVRFLGQIGKYY